MPQDQNPVKEETYIVLIMFGDASIACFERGFPIEDP
jgi:hypothetical protein